MSLVNILELNEISDDRGSLVALEGNKNIPFEIKRVYYMTGMQKDLSRGFHAHRNLEQLAICVSGSCKIILDDGSEKCEVFLDNPSTGLLISNMTWREMHNFSDNCVLLVLASEYYDEEDYIRDYSDFKSMVNT